MAAKPRELSLDTGRKHDEAFNAEALRLASCPKLLYRWQQAQFVAEAGSAEVARDPEVRALGRQQAVGTGARHLKKPWSVACCRRRLGQPTREHLRVNSSHQAQVPVRQLCHVLQVAPGAYYAGQRRH
jgi:transposase